MLVNSWCRVEVDISDVYNWANPDYDELGILFTFQGFIVVRLIFNTKAKEILKNT